jgi:hypothetical protein
MRIQELIPVVYVFGMIAVIGGVMLKVMDALALTGAGALFVGNVTTGLSNLATQLGLVGTIVALAVVIAVIMGAFAGSSKRA